MIAKVTIFYTVVYVIVSFLWYVWVHTDYTDEEWGTFLETNKFPARVRTMFLSIGLGFCIDVLLIIVSLFWFLFLR